MDFQVEIYLFLWHFPSLWIAIIKWNKLPICTEDTKPYMPLADRIMQIISHKPFIPYLVEKVIPEEKGNI